MKYDNEWVVDQVEKDKNIKFLFFWGHQPLKNGEIGKSCFSQWFEKEFVFEQTTYKTTEHWMMAEKARLFKDSEIEQRILECKTAAEAKKLGRKVKEFEPEIWDNQKFEIVKKGNYLKFSQNKDLKEFILNTNERILVEASPYDSIWGIGMVASDENVNYPINWKGENLLGYVLMEVRDLLKK